MAKLENLIENPELFDTLVAYTRQGKITFPGVSKVSIKPVGLNEEVEEINGGSATITKLGRRPKEVTVENTVWTVEQFDKVKAVINLFSNEEDEIQEFEVLHPLLEIAGIKKLYIFEMEIPRYEAGGEFTVTYQMREWEEKVTEKPTQRIGSGEAVNAAANGTPSLESMPTDAPKFDPSPY